MKTMQFFYNTPGADPGFLERRFRCIKGGPTICYFYLIFLKYPHENEIIWSKWCCFVFFWEGGGGAGQVFKQTTCGSATSDLVIAQNWLYLAILWLPIFFILEFYKGFIGNGNFPIIPL